MVHGFQGRVDDNEYIDYLYHFVNLFYKERIVQERSMTEKLSEMLTTSDEAFFLLCIKVYFNDHTDLENEIYNANDIHVTKNGWRKEGIDLYNNIYAEVAEDRKKNNAVIDKKFAEYMKEMIEDDESRDTPKLKLRIIHRAYNDL